MSHLWLDEAEAFLERQLGSRHQSVAQRIQRLQTPGAELEQWPRRHSLLRRCAACPQTAGSESCTQAENGI